MSIGARGVRLARNVSPTAWRAAAVALAGLALACTRKEAPELKPAAAPPPPPPVAVRDAAPEVRDAAPDVGDAAVDAGDARRGGKRAATPAAGGGSGAGGGLKVTGSLSHADGEKVVRAAQGKLRDCFEHANAKGKGRVSFQMTVDDRGRVTVAEIPTSSLPGGSDVETCMVHVLRDLRFPRGGGESTISFQMSFGR
ncbi:MAG TPA: AgmX/PglI C-terminal domain-containing protein [Polyangia bacterium]